MGRPVVGVCLAAALLTPSTEAVRQPVPNYRQIVSDYRGMHGTAVGRLEELDPDRAGVLADRALASEPPWQWEDLRAAAILHTEVWFSCAVNNCPAEKIAHLFTAERLLDGMVRQDPVQVVFVDRWYTVVRGLLMEWRRETLAEEFRQRAATRLPSSPARARALLAYRRGLAAEFQGSTSGTIFGGSRAIHDPDNLQTRWWGAAASEYREALEYDSTLEVAALHLGRVRMLSGQTAEARALFERSRASADKRVAYLSSLFLGSLAEGAGQLDEAARHYAAALDAYPYGQAAPLAMSQLLSRAGREADARRILVQAFGPDRGRRVEPLWTYLQPPHPDRRDFIAWFDELRTEVLR